MARVVYFSVELVQPRLAVRERETERFPEVGGPGHAEHALELGDPSDHPVAFRLPHVPMLGTAGAAEQGRLRQFSRRLLELANPQLAFLDHGLADTDENGFGVAALDGRLHSLAERLDLEAQHVELVRDEIVHKPRYAPRPAVKRIDESVNARVARLNMSGRLRICHLPACDSARGGG
jgi:hypothetical protein